MPLGRPDRSKRKRRQAQVTPVQKMEILDNVRKGKCLSQGSTVLASFGNPGPLPYQLTVQGFTRFPNLSWTRACRQTLLSFVCGIWLLAALRIVSAQHVSDLVLPTCTVAFSSQVVYLEKARSIFAGTQQMRASRPATCLPIRA